MPKMSCIPATLRPVDYAHRPWGRHTASFAEDFAPTARILRGSTVTFGSWRPSPTQKRSELPDAEVQIAALGGAQPAQLLVQLHHWRAHLTRQETTRLLVARTPDTLGSRRQERQQGKHQQHPLSASARKMPSASRRVKDTASAYEPSPALPLQRWQTGSLSCRRNGIENR